MVFRDPVARAGLLRAAEALGELGLLERVMPEEVDEDAPDRLRQGHECHLTAPGPHLRRENAWVPRGVDRIARSGSFTAVEILVPSPLLMIAGSEATTARAGRTAVESAGIPAGLPPSAPRSSASPRPGTRAETERPESPPHTR
ncbi:hypothetical protein ACOT81_42785 [Streptomyces sp. WI04-05B]|uniref:hypothetical protein n=1 Tax=Streptomyces TaxID=1883 RepID=UPI0029A3C9D8|nr:MULTISPECIES: hypothetical protein [unclassified Streptomyces]MDX2548163.1 hypothetical protein [Streptomyces sp. WI04-05B]MDX2583161.1 hypothetical protein [Streptomyces sp. WI04-05A]